MKRNLRPSFTVREQLPYRILVVFLVVVFLTGGGARGDIQSLLILRPLAIIVAGIGMLGLRWGHVRTHSFVFAGLAACYAFILLHALPLPPALWQALPGRELVVDIDRTVGLGRIWRPLSLAPAATWNAFFALFVPLAVAILAAQLSREQLNRLVPVILIIGLVSGLMGALQLMSPSDSPLYLYRITNSGQAVGLFSNRNHQAIFLALLIPLLAVFAGARGPNERGAGRSAVRHWTMLAGLVVLVPLILITGSRTGLIVGLVGLVALPAIGDIRGTLRSTLLIKASRTGLAIGSALLVGTTGLTIYLSRAQALDRLFRSAGDDELRLRVWAPILDMGWKYFPIGSGIGSFVETYWIDEPRQLLRATYLNHAHNDWLEIFLTAGLLGVLLALLGVAGMVWLAIKVFRKERESGSSLARGGAVIAFLLVLASLADYPLRTPSLASVFVVALIWLARGARDKNGSDGNLARLRDA